MGAEDLSVRSDAEVAEQVAPPTAGETATLEGVQEYDLVVIGVGAGAEIAAREAARRGFRVAVVASGDEAADPVALRALDYALREAARHVSRRHGDLPGLGEDGPRRSTAEWASVVGWIKVAQQRVWSPGWMERMAAAGVSVLAGPPAFLRHDALSDGGRPVRFRRAILAVPPRWARPPLDGSPDLAEGLTAETLFGLHRLPQRLAVVGTGPRACIWAQAFQRLGSEVCLVGRERSILPNEDEAAADVVRKRLTAEGVPLLLGCSGVIVDQIGNRRALVLERDGSQEKHLFDRIFLEQSLDPQIDGLQLDAAGVALSSGGVSVNDRLQTSNRRIIAVGAVCGNSFASPELTEAMARFAAGNAFGLLPRRFKSAIVPRCVWTDPEIIRVGWTPTETIEHGARAATYCADCRDSVAALLSGEDEGFLRVQVAEGSGRVVGVTMVGQHTSELVEAAEWLITSRERLDAVAELVACRPTRFELLEQVANAYRDGLPRRGWQLWLYRARAWWSRVVGRCQL